jgi:microtubule-associated protein-like 1/2
LVAVDEGSDHTMTVWDWQRSEQGEKAAEAKCSNKETVIAAEFHPLDPGLIVTCGKGHVNFWHLEQQQQQQQQTNGGGGLIRKTGLFDAKADKPKYVTCLAFGSTGDVITGDSNGNIFIWRRGYNAVTKSLKKVHNGPIFAICVLKDGSVISGGGKDKYLVQLDATYRKSGLEIEVNFKKELPNFAQLFK